MRQAEVCHAGESDSRSDNADRATAQWTYQVVPGWGQLPAGTAFGGTHGGIATDKAGISMSARRARQGFWSTAPMDVC